VLESKRVISFSLHRCGKPRTRLVRGFFCVLPILPLLNLALKFVPDLAQSLQLFPVLLPLMPQSGNGSTAILLQAETFLSCFAVPLVCVSDPLL
jgi:hypothetical protein